MAFGPTQGSQAARAASLLFSLEDLNFERLAQTTIDEAEQYDPVLEIAQIKQACAPNEEVAKLVVALQDAKNSSISAMGLVDMSYVGSYLRSKHGYFILLRTANSAKRPRSYLRMLRHSYLVCRGIEGVGSADVLIDINFKDNFILPHSTTWYSKLVAALPQDWVGTAASLAPLVGLMSAGIRLCFRQAGIPLPPWREGRAVLSKWVPEVYEEAALPIVPLPDPALKRMLAPYHAPFRAAVRAAAAVQASEMETVGRQQQLPGPIQLPQLPSSQVALPHTIAIGGRAARAPGDHAIASVQGHGAIDVPRKIIVGFPERDLATASEGSGTATELLAQLQEQVQCEQQITHQRQQTSWPGKCTQFAAGAMFAADADLAAALPQGPPVIPDQQTDETMHGGNPARALQNIMPSVPTKARMPAAVDEQSARPMALSPAGALTSPHGGPVFAAAATAAASSSNRRGAQCLNMSAKCAAQRVCSTVVDLTPAVSSISRGFKTQCWQQSPDCAASQSKQATPQQTQQQQQQQQKQKQEGPASPWASQQHNCVCSEVGCNIKSGTTHRHAAPAGSAGTTAAVSCGSPPGLVINRVWLKQQLGQQVSAAGLVTAASPVKTDSGSHGMPAQPEGGKGPGVRQFKTLDQLLPRVRIVKLGVV